MSNQDPNSSNDWLAVARTRPTKDIARKPYWCARTARAAVGTGLVLMVGAGVAVALWHQREARTDYFFITAASDPKFGLDLFNMAYEDDSLLGPTLVCAARDDAKVFVFVNGSPFLLPSSGAEIGLITHFLQRGDNTIELRGEHQYPMFIKVFTAIDRKYPEIPRSPPIVAKTRFPPDVDSVTLRFHVDKELPSLLDALPQHGEKKEECTREVLAVMTQLWKHINNGEAEAAANLCSPRRIVNELKDASLRMAFQSAHSRMVSWIEEKVNPLVLTELSDLEVVYGDRRVQVYEKGKPVWPASPDGHYSMRIEVGPPDDRQVTYWAPLGFARVSGQWVAF